MPRARAILQSEFPYHITGRCINREWFTLSKEQVWHIFCAELTRIVHDHGLLVHSFVLMSNHFHLIASTPNANVSICMMNLMRRTSRRITRSGCRINETYAGRHYKCVLASTSYFLNAYKYNYRNPVEAGLCARVEDYPFSTLRGKLGLDDVMLPLTEDTILLSDPLGTVEWLNRTPDPEKLEGVRYALKRPLFKSKKSPVTKKLLIADGDTL
jgi:putative transposase